MGDLQGKSTRIFRKPDGSYMDFVSGPGQLENHSSSWHGVEAKDGHSLPGTRPAACDLHHHGRQPSR